MYACFVQVRPPSGVSSTVPAAAMLRRMLDTADVTASAQEAADITVVKTARELQAAITDGAQDILIQSHLDFSELPLAETTPAHTVLSNVRGSTRSIRVRL